MYISKRLETKIMIEIPHNAEGFKFESFDTEHNAVWETSPLYIREDPPLNILKLLDMCHAVETTFGYFLVVVDNKGETLQKIGYNENLADMLIQQYQMKWQHTGRID